MLQREAALLAFNDAFYLETFLLLVMLTTLWIIRKPPVGTATPPTGAHVVPALANPGPVFIVPTCQWGRHLACHWRAGSPPHSRGMDRPMKTPIPG